MDPDGSMWTIAAIAYRVARIFSPSMRRRTDLLVRRIEALRQAVRRTRAEWPFHIDAWVVLPDHLHGVLTLPRGEDDFSNRIKAIKIRFVVEPSERRQRWSAVRCYVR